MTQTNMAPRNVVFFGQSGHGKSSVINLILGEDRAPTARAAAGCTAECTGYPHRLDGQEFILWDTCGLNEGQHGTITDFKAVGSLYKLLKKFEDGVSLLVFCFNGGRVNEVAQRNWELFRDIICQKQVPTVMAITNLEDEEDMDGWWTENEAMFLAYGINPSSDFGSGVGVACITASRGKKLGDGRYRFQDEYETSQTKIRRLIVQNSRFSPWKVPSVTWFKQIITTSVQTQWCKKSREIKEAHQVPDRGIWELVIRWNMTEEEAAKMARELESE